MRLDSLIDTDVFVDHLRGSHAIDPGWRPRAYSVITRAELFAGSPDEHEAVSRLLASLHEIPVDRMIAERAGTIRRRYEVALPDAIIAASAIIGGFELRTRNRRHFEQISALRLA